MNSHNSDNHNDSNLLKKLKLVKPQPFQFSYEALMDKLYNINHTQYDKEYNQCLEYKKQYMIWYQQQPDYIPNENNKIDMSPLFYFRRWKQIFKDKNETTLQKFLTCLIIPVLTLATIEATGNTEILIDKFNIGFDIPILIIPLSVVGILTVLHMHSITGHILADVLGIPCILIQKAMGIKPVNTESIEYKKSMEMALEYLHHPIIYRNKEKISYANLKERNFLLVNDFMCKYPYLNFDYDAWQAAQATANEFVCREGIRKENY